LQNLAKEGRIVLNGSYIWNTSPESVRGKRGLFAVGKERNLPWHLPSAKQRTQKKNKGLGNRNNIKSLGKKGKYSQHQEMVVFPHTINRKINEYG
jgi:hypothetical protein